MPKRCFNIRTDMAAKKTTLPSFARFRVPKCRTLKLGLIMLESLDECAIGAGDRLYVTCKLFRKRLVRRLR